jgi:hypothetical protein
MKSSSRYSTAAAHHLFGRSACFQPLALREMTREQGPTESVAEAQAIVKDLMERPLPKPLLVDLTVDIKHADTWYEAK